MMVHVLSDDDAVRDSLDVLLQANYLPVRTYAAPDDLIQEVAPKPSGCVLLDVGPKSANPVELSHRLRARGLSLPIIVLAGDLPPIRVKQPDTIALQKPVEPKALIEVVQKVLAKS